VNRSGHASTSLAHLLLDAAGLLTPRHSAGGQRRYSRADLALASRVPELLHQNMPLTAATRIVSLEHQLAAPSSASPSLNRPATSPAASADRSTDRR
jgi:DNA-binding transcriptional MerR regulator